MRAGRREGQVHLTLSRAALLGDFNHYLTRGSEFDQHVAYQLLGYDGTKMLEQDGQPWLMKVRVPGIEALEAAHPLFSIDDLTRRGDLPNIAREFLYVWSYRLFAPDYHASDLRPDCGIQFSRPVPPPRIVRFIPVAPEALRARL